MTIDAVPAPAPAATVLVGEPAVLLSRKSQVRIEGDRDTIERQFHDGEAYALRHTDPNGNPAPLRIVAKLADEESGYKAGGKNARPGLREALRMLEAGEAKHLIVARLDRLTRQGPLAFLQILQQIQKTGGRLHILEIPGLGRDIDTSGGLGQGILALLAGVASEWSERTSKNVKAAELQSAAAGRRHGGRRPFGWHQAPKAGEAPCPSCAAPMRQEEVRGRLVAVIELCPVESVILREAARRISAGETPRSVVLDFNRRGTKTVSGKLWSPSTLTRALQSPAIAGKRTHLGVEYDGVFPPILTPEEHAAVMAELGRESTRAATPSGKTPLLSGLGILFCQCGAPMRSALRARPGQADDRYRCTGMDPASEGCGSVTAVQGGVDKAVVAFAIRGLEHWQKSMQVPGRTDFEVLAERLEADKQALTDLTHARYVARNLDEESFRSAYDPLKVRVEETEGLLEAARPPVRDESEMVPGPDVSIQEWWDAKDIAEKRTILKYYLNRITVKAANGKGPRFDTKRVVIDWRLNRLAEVVADIDLDALTDEEAEQAQRDAS